MAKLSYIVELVEEDSLMTRSNSEVAPNQKEK